MNHLYPSTIHNGIFKRHLVIASKDTDIKKEIKKNLPSMISSVIPAGQNLEANPQTIKERLTVRTVKDTIHASLKYGGRIYSYEYHLPEHNIGDDLYGGEITEIIIPAGGGRPYYNVSTLYAEQ